MTVVTRFAPAPTGELHLGHVLNAIVVWGVARGLGGRVLLRIEDHDRQRCRHEFETSILDDLDWLGFTPDAPATGVLRMGRCVDGRQSDRHAIYANALERLKEQGLVYACECSRAQIASASAGDREVRYAGTCAGKGLTDGAGRGLRLRLERSIERFVDLRHGPQEQVPAEQCGDMLVRDRAGNYTYQFVAAVDDTVQRVTLVIRGDDLLASTGRQIQLARLLGRHEPPRFLHHALIMKSPTQKLSKADHDTSVADLRRAGWSPEAVIGRAAALGGLVGGAAPLGADTAGALAYERFASVTGSLR